MEVLAPTAAKASLSSAVAASPLRSDVPRRLQDLTALELLAKLTVEHAGAIFLGIQLGSTKNGERQPTLVLFSSPNTPTPLALSIYDVSTPAIRKAIAESDRQINSAIHRRPGAR